MYAFFIFSSGKLSDAPPVSDSTTNAFSQSLTSTSKSHDQQVLDSDDIILQSGSGMIPCDEQSEAGSECKTDSSDEIITVKTTIIPIVEKTTSTLSTKPTETVTATSGKPTTKTVPIRLVSVNV